MRSVPVRLSILLLVPWLAGCLTSRVGELPPPPPVLLAPPDPFTGGRLSAGVEEGYAGDVQRARFSFYDDGRWIEIGEARETVYDADLRTGRFTVTWNVSDLAPGAVPVRVEMWGPDGGYGVEVREVVVSPPPPLEWTVERRDGRAVRLRAEGPSPRWIRGDKRVVQGPVLDLSDCRGDPFFAIGVVTANEWGASAREILLLTPEGEVVGSARAAAGLALVETGILEMGLQAPPDVAARLGRIAERVGSARREMGKVAGSPTLAHEALAAALDLAVAFATDPAVQRFGLRWGDRVPGILLSPSGPVLRTPAATALELGYLRPRRAELARILAEKKARGDLAAHVARRRDEIVDLLEEAKSKLASADGHLAATPPDLDAAEADLDAAREKLLEAARKARTFPALRANEALIHQVYLELSLLSGRIWMRRQLGEESPYVGTGDDALQIPEIDQGADGRSHYDPDEGEIHVTPHRGPNDDTVFHELDHSFFHQKTNLRMPGGEHEMGEDLAEREREVTRADGSTTTRKLGRLDGEQLAFSEAWADFSSAAKQGDPEVFGEDLEEFEHRRENQQDVKGATVEGTVAELLWDLWDGSEGAPDSTDEDGFEIPFRLLWEALCPRGRTPGPRDIGEFRRRLVGVLSSNGWTDPQLDRLDDFFESRGCD